MRTGVDRADGNVFLTKPSPVTQEKIIGSAAELDQRQQSKDMHALQALAHNGNRAKQLKDMHHLVGGGLSLKPKEVVSPLQLQTTDVGKAVRNAGIVQKVGPAGQVYAESDQCHFDRHLPEWTYYFPGITTEANVRTVAQTLFAAAGRYDWTQSGGNGLYDRPYQGRTVRLVWSTEGRGITSCFVRETRSESAQRVAAQQAAVVAAQAPQPNVQAQLGQPAQAPAPIGPQPQVQGPQPQALAPIGPQPQAPAPIGPQPQVQGPQPQAPAPIGPQPQVQGPQPQAHVQVGPQHNAQVPTAAPNVPQQQYIFHAGYYWAADYSYWLDHQQGNMVRQRVELQANGIRYDWLYLQYVP